MRLLRIELGGRIFEGHCAVTGDGTLRVISQYGSRSVQAGGLPLPLEIQAEMAMAEIAAEFQRREGAGLNGDNQSAKLEEKARNAWSWFKAP